MDNFLTGYECKLLLLFSIYLFVLFISDREKPIIIHKRLKVYNIRIEKTYKLHFEKSFTNDSMSVFVFKLVCQQTPTQC